jgi:hypothetical protein
MIDRPFYVPHPDDDYIDEIRVVIRERYKTSGLSGDEWRFHRVIQFFRKGTLLWERPFNGHTREVASFVPWMLVEAGESGALQTANMDDLCFQPGCSDPFVSEYEIIEEFGPQGQRLHPDERVSFSKRRRFCAKHLRRGDCSREDCDTNYRVISGPGPDEANWTGANVTESARVDVLVNSLDEIPAAIDQVRRDHFGS